MLPSVWILLAFLAGAAVGALLVAVHRVSTISRLREEFRTELEALAAADHIAFDDKAVADSSRRPEAA